MAPHARVQALHPSSSSVDEPVPSSHQNAHHSEFFCRLACFKRKEGRFLGFRAQPYNVHTYCFRIRSRGLRLPATALLSVVLVEESEASVPPKTFLPQSRAEREATAMAARASERAVPPPAARRVASLPGPGTLLSSVPRRE